MTLNQQNHDDPHFNEDGYCNCGCSKCSNGDGCSCPACECRNGESLGAAIQRAKARGDLPCP